MKIHETYYEAVGALYRWNSFTISRVGIRYDYDPRLHETYRDQKSYY